MPSFTEEIEFEVYCNSCGAGLCNESIATIGRRRSEKQVRVNACPDCLKEKQNEINDLINEKIDLEKQIEQLESKIEQLTYNK